jgi:RNA polymerase sigma factor (sigma-70 family)
VTKTIGRHRAGEASGEATAGAPADAELLVAVRAGDTAAFGVLYDRHSEAARRLARVLVREPSDAEDLVAEAFAKVLAALRLGRGPEVAFRAYLLTAVRHACYDRTRRDRRIEFTEDLTRYETTGGPTTGDQAVARLERSYAARAFAKLPERWQMVLWHTEVEGEKPATIAPMLGLSPNAVAALAYRARERLRQMYLQEHLNVTENPTCHWTCGRLGAHVRHGLPRREQSKVDAHLADCEDCRALWAELAEINSGLRGVLAPVVLGAAATPYLTTVPSVAWWYGVVEAVRHGWSTALDRLRELVRRHGSTNVAAGVGLAAAALVGVALFALALALGPDPDPADEEPPVAAEPGRPVPVPVPAPSPETPPPPAEPPSDEAAQPGFPAAMAPPAPSTSRSPESPRPPAPAPVAVAPDLSATSLAAGEDGELAITVLLPADHGEKHTIGDQLTSRFSLIDVKVGLPAGIELAGADAGDGWRCVASERSGAASDAAGITGSSAGAACQRPAWPAGESRTARLPVTVDETLGGFAPITVTVTAGRQRSEAGFRVPVAPVGLRVGYAATGPYRLAMAGNTWLSCPTRPDCLLRDRLDNNLVRLQPYLPGAGDPAVPPGLADPVVAASGAELPVPAGAEVAWAALHWATTAGEGPELVRLHSPAGGWHSIAPDAVQLGGGRPLRQAYADVTELVRAGGGGPWWVAAGSGPLPTTDTVSAGWSLTVVYADANTPDRDLAVFTGPVSLTGQRSLSVTASSSGEPVEVGLAAWEGDRTLDGDRLRLDDQPLGDPENALASRAAGALECGGTPAAGCGWHTFGVDVGQHQGTGLDGGMVSLHTERDLVEIGVLVLAVDSPR